LVLFATQIVLALLTKAAPQVNVWILGMPLQVFLAMILVGLGIAVVPEFLGNLITRALGDASAILVGH
ncbi:MAG: flagellar biosynthetic protein FliR, partial [Actinomycetota bacterium]|nr:flagellar biosynthetic protein FliR [Actinomycetota bacterium]